MREAIDKINELIDEQTTMADIAYLPSGFTDIKNMLSILAKKKKEWHIDILEDDKGRVLTFGDELKINVPNEHWDHFVNNVFKGKDILNQDIVVIDDILETADKKLRHKGNLMDIALANYRKVEEQREEDRPKAESEMIRLEDLLLDALEISPLKDLTDVIMWFRSIFGGSIYKDVGATLKYPVIETDIFELLEKLRELYKSKIENITLLVSAISNQKPMDVFKVFHDSKNIYGTIAESDYRGIKLILKAVVDNNWILTETLQINDPDIIDKVEEEFANIITVHDTAIYPKGAQFNMRFFRDLKMLIDSKV